MTYPTPTGNPSTATQLTSQSWVNQPTTPTSEAETINIVKQHYGSSTAAKFKTWYDAALKKDPKLTPNQAVATFLTGFSLSGNLGSTATALGKIPNAAATGANNAYNTLTSPLSGLAAIGDFFSKLGNANTWLRVVKVGIGAVMVVSGIVHLSGVDKKSLGIASKVILPEKIG